MRKWKYIKQLQLFRIYIHTNTTNNKRRLRNSPRCKKLPRIEDYFAWKYVHFAIAKAAINLKIYESTRNGLRSQTLIKLKRFKVNLIGRLRMRTTTREINRSEKTCIDRQCMHAPVCERVSVGSDIFFFHFIERTEQLTPSHRENIFDSNKEVDFDLSLRHEQPSTLPETG